MTLSFVSIEERNLKLSQEQLNYDVVVIGSGAGGSLAALKACEAGKKVALIEMGPGAQTKDFVLDEGVAYKNLYQEAAGRTTLGGEVTVLQGRTLGGGTTVNWTSSFRTPSLTLKYWREVLGLKEFSEKNLESSFSWAENLLGVKPWDLTPNANNDLLAQGLKKMGIEPQVIPRNVRDCQNLGYCGFGCPVGAKQSAFLTTLPLAQKLGLKIFTDALAKHLIIEKEEVTGLEVVSRETQKKILFKAKEFVLAAGAIGSPALLLRSKAPDPFGLVGKRTFLHPTTISGGHFKEEVAPYYGAPQSIYSDAFLPKDLNELAAGFKLEVPPVHPLLLATSLPLRGKDHRDKMAGLPHTQAIIALQRDGFHKQSQGGQVILKKGRPFLDYQWTPYMEKAFRKSLEVMGECQFAAGAQEVLPLHRHGKNCKTLAQLKSHVSELSMKALDLKVVSAHVMGGCAMGENPEKSVTNLRGKYHHLKNLVVRDGSLFPTSLGTNPMLSIIALVHYMESNA